MRQFILLPVLATLVAADVIATCARDNCLRAVIASGAKPGPSSASADCSSYFKGTTSHAVPTYASACSGSARYTSACSCIGVTKTTISPTSTPTTDCSAFYLKIQGATNPDIVYAVLPNADDQYIASFTGNTAEAAKFTLTADGSLISSGHIADMEKATNLGTVFFQTNPTASNRVVLKCTRSAANILSCTGNGASTNLFEFCPGTCGRPPNTAFCGGVSLGNYADVRCGNFTFETIGVCTV
ncbi:hypothetical protein ONS95_002969 [Cadophora gregata]|uniref:uncharacterized protein n=1 Tax=Cadophora gregata TaxID=51156 RepID=UPI0026DDA495|nr:uncharacterized protein ONS95_002969 [Cadophora gregata]KAK0108147.1 hypothetical protein ONS95_002969 [Cadophora gregata]KAK0109258.1 hypothetical protein ONS96_003080 [Cadophora gregata f. sp. sojae]